MKENWIAIYAVAFVFMTAIGIALSYAYHKSTPRVPHMCETPAGRDDPRCVGWYAYDRAFNR
jgi:hypothetical protein